MNKAIFESFKKLSDTEKAELEHKFRDSPVGLRLIGFLNNAASRTFKNTEAVAWIYKDDKANYSVLENRYFKLRKKLLDEMQPGLQADTSALLTEEEQELYSCRSSNSAENREQISKRLTALEKSCWDKNIFELLPAVIDQLIFCNQTLNRIDRNKPAYTRLEKAITLQHDMMRCCMFARKVYEINYTKGIRQAKKELAGMKELAARHREYPRFLMCYHHVSLYYKLGSRDYLRELQVISRHLSGFKKLYAQHPAVPLISYKANYIKVQHFHFANISMFYHFNRCEFREAYEAMKQTWDLVFSSDSAFKVYRTESLFYNMFTSQCMAGHFREANETCDLYMTFLKENNQYTKLSFAYTLKARIYADTYPQPFKMDPDFLLEQVDDYIRSLKKSDNVQASLDETLVLKARLLIISGHYEKAMKVLKDPIAKAFLESLDESGLMTELCMILMKGKELPAKLKALLMKTEQVKRKATTPGQYMCFNWILKFAQHSQRAATA